MNKIVSVSIAPPAFVHLEYASGEQFDLDFSNVINQGGVFSRLGDPEYFSQVALGEQGRSITWPNGLDFCADALLEEAHIVR